MDTVGSDVERLGVGDVARDTVGDSWMKVVMTQVVTKGTRNDVSFNLFLACIQ